MSQIIKTNTGGGSLPADVATSYVTNAGTAVPAANVLEIIGNNTANNGFATWVTGSTNVVEVNSYGTAKWVVNPIAGVGTQQTITAAIAAASSGDTIFITPASYTENPIITKNLNFVTYDTKDQNSPSSVIILGKISFGGTSLTATFNGMSLLTNSDYCVDASGNGNIIVLKECSIFANNHDALLISSGNNANNFDMNDCIFNVSDTFKLFAFSVSSGAVTINRCKTSSTGAPAASTLAGMSLYIFYSDIAFPILTSAGGVIQALHTTIGTVFSPYQNLTFLQLGASLGNIIEFCEIYSGTASAISIAGGVALTATFCTINSANTNAITGTGTINLAGIAFTGSSSTVNATLTENILPFIPSGSGSGVLTITGDTGGAESPTGGGNFSLLGTANQIAVTGGTNKQTFSLIGPYSPSTYTAHGVILGEGTSSMVATAAGSAGQVLQSGGASADPAYSTPTYPSASGSAGVILRSDGTNNVYTTATYPNTATKGDLIYASAANIISDLAISTYPGAPLFANDLGLPAYNSPRNYVWLYDDFVAGTINSALGWSGQTLNSGSSIFNGSTSTNANPGVFQMTTNANTAGAASLKLGQSNGSAGYIVPGGGYISTVFYCKLSSLSNGTDTYTVTIGLVDISAGLTTITDGLYFTYSSSGSTPNWVINSTAASTTTSSTSNTAADTSWHRFRIDINAAASSVAFYIDDVALNVSPLTTNIPTLQISPFVFILKSAGTSSRNIQIDYFTFYQNLTSSR